MSDKKFEAAAYRKLQEGTPVNCSTTDLQKFIFDKVVERGYMQGWGDSQFAKRQLFKAGEELAELIFEAMPSLGVKDPGARIIVEAFGDLCRTMFDNEIDWGTESVGWLRASNAVEEAADVIIPLMAFVEVLNYNIDLGRVAAGKVAADVSRGVRK